MNRPAPPKRGPHQSTSSLPHTAASQLLLAEATWAGITGRPSAEPIPTRGDRTQTGVALGHSDAGSPDPRPCRHRRTRPLAAQNMTCWTAQVVGCTWSSAASWRISAAG
jgi:hypothetical protein